jgi:hypothetical protein
MNGNTMNTITRAKNHIKTLPLDVQMFFFSLVMIPAFLAILTIIHLLSPISLTPEMMPGLFDSSDILKTSLIYQTVCLMVTLFYGLIKGGQDGGVGICTASLGYAGLIHFFG